MVYLLREKKRALRFLRSLRSLRSRFARLRKPAVPPGTPGARRSAAARPGRNLWVSKSDGQVALRA